MSGDTFSLAGRRALVTRANSGIGRALALGLARHGADMILHHVAAADAAHSLRREIAEMGRNAEVMEADFTEAARAPAASN